MIIIDNNKMNSYGGREIIRQDLNYLIHELASEVLRELHTEIIKELKRRDEKDRRNINAENDPNN